MHVDRQLSLTSVLNRIDFTFSLGRQSSNYTILGVSAYVNVPRQRCKMYA